MNSLGQRQLVGLFGFALAAVWIGLGTLTTLLSLLAGAAFYLGAARLQGRRRTTTANGPDGGRRHSSRTCCRGSRRRCRRSPRPRAV